MRSSTCSVVWATIIRRAPEAASTPAARTTKVLLPAPGGESTTTPRCADAARSARTASTTPAASAAGDGRRAGTTRSETMGTGTEGTLSRPSDNPPLPPARVPSSRTLVLMFLTAALAYARHGIPVLPVHTPAEDGSCSCGRSTCDRVGKHPRVRHGLSEASTDETRLQMWWTRWPDANIGLRTGVVMDVADVDS